MLYRVWNWRANLKNIQSECKLLFCMGENKRMLSFKEEGYQFFDQAIGLLDDSKMKITR